MVVQISLRFFTYPRRNFNGKECIRLSAFSCQDTKMNLDEAQSLKQSILNEYYENVIRLEPLLRAESAPPIERPERRIAVGLSGSKGKYRVEIRIQRARGAAQSLANELRLTHRDKVHVAVIEKLEIAPISSIVRLPPARPEAKAGSSAGRARPLEIGLSVGHNEGPPGSIGAFVELAEGGDAILSNAHVLANGAKIDDPIYQPGRETRNVTARDEIGYLANYIPLRRKGANTADAAVAMLKDGIQHQRNRIPPPCGAPCSGKYLQGVSTALDFNTGEILAKVGRATRYTEGNLSAASIDDITVLYHGMGNLRFDNVVEITWKDVETPFTQPGDSGSVIFAPSNMEAIGLHFAGGVLTRDGVKVGVSYACDLKTVLDSLDATLIY